jgi:hypothetical protein
LAADAASHVDSADGPDTQARPQKRIAIENPDTNPLKNLICKS